MDKIVKQPLVTVLMPVYNGKRHLEEAIESVINQTYQNIEILIIDDGSTDGSSKIISRYKKNDKRLRVISHKRNMGLVPSLNEGIDCSRGEYIARMDADDISISERLAKQVGFMQRKKNIGLVGTRYFVIDENGQIIKAEQSLLSNDLLKKVVLFRSPFCHGSIMIRKSLLNSEKYSPSKNFFEDYDLWARLSKVTDFYIIPDVLYMWRLSENGVTKSNLVKMKKGSESVSKWLQGDYVSKKINLHEMLKIINDSRKYKNKIIVCDKSIRDCGQHGYQLLIINLAILNIKRGNLWNFTILFLAFILINPLRPIIWIGDLLRNRIFI